jgi:WD40 repeat protein
MVTICCVVCVSAAFAADERVHLVKSVTLKRHQWPVALAVSQDGRILASGGYDDEIVLWNAATGVPFGSIKAKNETISCLTFSHDDRLLAAGNKEGEIKVWEVKARKMLRTFSMPGDYEWQVTDVAFTRENRRVICSSWARADRIGQALVGDLENGKVLHKIMFESPWFVKLGWLSNGDQLAISHGDKIGWWEMKETTFTTVTELEEQQWVHRFANHPKGDMLANGLKTIYIIGADKKVRLTNMRHSIVGVGCCGKTLVTWDQQKHQLHIWDYESQKCLQSIELPREEIPTTMLPDGGKLITQNRGELTSWELKSK